MFCLKTFLPFGYLQSYYLFDFITLDNKYFIYGTCGSFDLCECLSAHVINSGAMDPAHCSAITRNFQSLLAQTDLHTMVTALYEKGVFNDLMIEPYRVNILSFQKVTISFL